MSAFDVAPPGSAGPEGGTASAWLVRHAGLLAGRSTALDVAAGGGRHLRWLQAQGLRVTAVDRDAGKAALWPPDCEAVITDLERDGWPFGGRRFDVVVVTNYLWRPLLPAIVGAVAPDGVLVYETFALGQEKFGRPSNPEFLLRPGELLEATRGLHTDAYEDLLLDGPPRFVQRIVCSGEASGRLARSQPR